MTVCTELGGTPKPSETPRRAIPWATFAMLMCEPELRGDHGDGEPVSRCSDRCGDGREALEALAGCLQEQRQPGIER